VHILIIDTASKHFSLSLIDILSGNSVASYLEKDDENSHARKINLTIKNLLLSRKLNMSTLKAIALNEGPGSFTGLRVGSSTAKGLCFALDIPLISICGLVAYGRYLYSKKDLDIQDVFVLMDARRGNYFYSEINDLNQESIAQFNHITEIETRIYLSRKPWIYYLEKDYEMNLSAENLTDEVLKKWLNKEFVDIRIFEPKYIVNNYLTKK